MMFYHYNSNKLDSIKSLSAQNNTWKPGKKNERDYDRHVSFFTSELPKDLPTILHNKHSFYKKGTVIYKHEIDPYTLPRVVPWKLTESPEKTDLLFRQQDWDAAMYNPNLRKKYNLEIEELEIKLGYIGNTREAMLEKAGKIGDLRPYYINLYKLYKETLDQSLMMKYAATVPHLMVYTGGLEIEVKSVSSVTLV